MTYDELFTFEHLYQAHLKARKCKRNKKDVILFELDLSANLWDLYHRLHNRTYEVSGYHKFIIYEPKQREIQALTYKDRVVQHVLCDLYLYPLLTKRFIYDNGACQKGKGTDFALDRLSQFFRAYYKTTGTNQGYILKADIHHFFPSVNHAVLKEKLRCVVDEPEILHLLEKIIDSYNAETGVGIPMGNQTSQMFALFYLDALDRLVKEQLRVKYYLRYMDDCILLSDSKPFLQDCLTQMRTLVERDQLEFNQKTQIFPMQNGVDFLGFHFYLLDTGKVIRKLRTSSKKRFKRRLKKMKRQFEAGKIDVEDIQKTLPGFQGHLQRGNTWLLRQQAMRSFVLQRPEQRTTEGGEIQTEQETIGDSSAAFALRCVKLYQFLTNEKQEFILSRQILKSGTNIGLLLRKAARTNEEDNEAFTALMQAAFDAATETDYWLELLQKAGTLTAAQAESMRQDCAKLQARLRAVI